MLALQVLEGGVEDVVVGCDLLDLPGEGEEGLHAVGVVFGGLQFSAFEFLSCQWRVYERKCAWRLILPISILALA